LNSFCLRFSGLESRGAAGPETRIAYTRALEIAESLDDAEYRLRALWGLWSYHTASGRHRVALELAQRFYALAAERPDPNDRLSGERAMGTSQHYLGDQPGARRHIDLRDNFCGLSKQAHTTHQHPIEGRIYYRFIPGAARPCSLPGNMPTVVLNWSLFRSPMGRSPAYRRG